MAQSLNFGAVGVPLQIIKQVERFARGQRIDIERLQPFAQGIALFRFGLRGSRGEQR